MNCDINKVHILWWADITPKSLNLHVLPFFQLFVLEGLSHFWILLAAFVWYSLASSSVACISCKVLVRSGCVIIVRFGLYDHFICDVYFLQEPCSVWLSLFAMVADKDAHCLDLLICWLWWNVDTLILSQCLCLLAGNVYK